MRSYCYFVLSHLNLQCNLLKIMYHRKVRLGGFNLKVHFFDVLKLMHLIFLSVFCIPKFLAVSRLALPGPKANLFY